VYFELIATQRERLRKQIVAAFDRDAFSMFASDKLGIADFRSQVPDTGFESQCHAFILLTERQGTLERLCIELKDARANKPGLVAVVSEILLTMSAQAAGQTHRHALMVGGRPFLNRRALRSKLTSFVEGYGLERLLFISGETATGKSYSRHLLSRSASGMMFASVELPAITHGEFEPAHLAGAICSRLWPDCQLDRFDDFGQQARDARWYGDRLVARLTQLGKPMLLFIDGFNAAPLSEGAADLTVRLCRAVENNECPNLWLALIGLEIERLGAEYDGLVEPELACPPDESDIEEFLQEVNEKSGNAVDASEIKPHSAALAAILGAKPTHTRWIDFTRQLMQTCKRIRNS
jgi:hypothetical protein